MFFSNIFFRIILNGCSLCCRTQLVFLMAITFKNSLLLWAAKTSNIHNPFCHKERSVGFFFQSEKRRSILENQIWDVTSLFSPGTTVVVAGYIRSSQSQAVPSSAACHHSLSEELALNLISQ